MNKLFFHPHCLLYLGESFDTVLHRHHSVQITIGVEENLQLVNTDGKALCAKAIIVPANYPHKLSASSSAIASLFIDVKSQFYQQLRLGCKHINLTHFQEVVLSKASLESLRGLVAMKQPDYVKNGLETYAKELVHGSADADVQKKVEHFIEQVINASTIKGICQTPLDDRILKVLEQLDNVKDGQTAIHDLANRVNLSASRLAHLFKAQVGIPIRRYSLWRRLRYAIAYAHQQQSLTEGAHYAGFADSAHLSRVFKEMFGISPSLIISAKRPVALFFL